MSLSIQHDADLRPFNSFGVAVRARELLTLDDEHDLPEALERLAGRAPVVLGGGSNLLLTRDIERPVLRPALRGLRFPEDGTRGVDTEAVVEAGAGEPWHGLVRATLARGLCGLENLALIPGSTGAAPIQNIGAYGVEMRERFHSLRAVHLATGERREFGLEDCRFGYRDSAFKSGTGRGWLVLAVRFRLSRRSVPRVDYGELRAELERRGTPLANDGRPEDALAVADAVEAVRRRKLPDPTRLGNAGSFFKNPVVDAGTAATLREREPAMPAWPADGGVKLSAGWLIERAGWKGARRGDAGVSPDHALVLVNHGTATGAELLALALAIQDDVLARFGVRLEPEPVVL